MGQAVEPKSDDDDHALGARASRARWRWRWPARMGLQGRLVACFAVLLVIGLVLRCALFLAQTEQVLDRLTAEQATEMVVALGMASQTPLQQHNQAELNRIGHDLLRHREVVAIGFFSETGELLGVASDDPDMDSRLLPNPQKNTHLLMQPQHGWLPAFGRYVQVTAPVMAFLPVDARAPMQHRTCPGGAGMRLVGYVTVFLSQAATDAAMRRTTLVIVTCNILAAMLALPIIMLLLHRAFEPIRRLAKAADRIAAGELGIQVPIDRPDAIGMLARSFNAMARKVLAQKKDLELANQSLSQANHDLEEKVRQRTVQLEAANKRLNLEIAEKEDFVRAISHDLSAPLRNISGMASMLLHKKRDTFDDEVIHRLTRIQKNVEVETGLISELTQLSRLKSLRRRMQNVDIGELVRDVAAIFESDLHSRQIRFVVDSPLPTLNCERPRMRQVFQNLIDNAVKYMGDGAPAEGGDAAPARRRKEIHVGCVARADEIEFYVEDTGIGIDPEDIETIFYVFRRGRSAAVRAVAGKGVGLASVKCIVETYSGTIWAESRPGQGSTFRFTINGKHRVESREPQLAEAL